MTQSLNQGRLFFIIVCLYVSILVCSTTFIEPPNGWLCLNGAVFSLKNIYYTTKY